MTTTYSTGGKDAKSACQVPHSQRAKIKKPLSLNDFYAPLAQLVEQLTLNKRAKKVKTNKW